MSMISLCSVFTLVYVCAVCDGHLMTPYGWRMCRDLCDSLTICSSPGYQEETLTCVLSNRSSGVGQGGRTCRDLMSRRGDRVTVCSREKVVEFVNPSVDIKLRVNEDNYLVCEVSKSDLKPQCTLNGVVILASQTVTFISDGNVHKLHIKNTGPNDKGVYEVAFAVSGNQGGNHHAMDLGCPVLMSNNLYGIVIGMQQVVYVDDHTVRCRHCSSIFRIKSIMNYKQGHVTVYNKITVWRTASSVVCGKRLEHVGNLDFVVYCLTGMKLKKAQLRGFEIVS